MEAMLTDRGAFRREVERVVARRDPHSRRGNDREAQTEAWESSKIQNESEGHTERRVSQGHVSRSQEGATQPTQRRDGREGRISGAQARAHETLRSEEQTHVPVEPSCVVQYSSEKVVRALFTAHE